jgi:hypothetical protein
MFDQGALTFFESISDGIVSRAIMHVEIGLVREQGIRDDVAAVLDAPEQERLSIVHAGIRIRAMLEQQLGDGDIAMKCRCGERSSPFVGALRGADAAVVLHEQTHQTEITAFAGDQEWCFAGIVVLLGKNAAGQQLLQRFLIAACDRCIDLIGAQGDALVQQRALGTGARITATDKQQRNDGDDWPYDAKHMPLLARKGLHEKTETAPCVNFL